MERSHVWLGVFGPDTPKEFFVEQYEDNDAPISAFAASQGEHWIDNDWLEVSWVTPMNLRELIDGHSYSDDYLEPVIARATALGLREANVFVLCDQGEIKNPATVTRPEMTLHFIGTFACQV